MLTTTSTSTPPPTPKRRRPRRPRQRLLDKLWVQLDTVAIDTDDLLTEPFHDFPAGTHLGCVLYWFNKHNPYLYPIH